MSKERVWMERNAGTAEEPQWEKYFPKTVADAIYASDADGETRKIMDLVREEIQKVVGTAPEAFDTLQEIAAYIEEHEEVAAALQQAITDKADKVHTHADATQSAAGFMSAEDKTKLDGIASGANKYVHPTGAGNNHIPAGGASGQVLTYKASGEAQWANPQKTEYGEATTDAAGLMSAEDKEKLDGIAEGANKYTHPTTSGNKHIPIGGASGKILGWKADGEAQWVDDKNTTYSPATSETNGLMSAADKEKLDGIAAGANNYTHPTTAGNKHIPTGGSAGKILGWKASGEAQWVDDKNTTYNKATSSSDGLMAKEDKTKLDTLPTITFGAEYPDNAPANSIHFLAE